MHCPKCGQFPLSDEVQFCTRCGLSVKNVRELITTDAVSPAKHEAGMRLTVASQRQQGTRPGAKLVFFGLASAPVTLLFSLLVDSPPYLFFFSILVVFIGTVRMLYARIFEELPSSTKQDTKSVRTQDSFLSNSPDVLPVSPKSFNPSPTEITIPHSITDHTTKLLDS